MFIVCVCVCVCVEPGSLGTEVGMFLFGGGQSGLGGIVKGELLNLERPEAICFLLP